MFAVSDTISILHVDDDPDFAEMAATFLEREDDRFSVETATGVREGLEYLADNDVHCVVSDYDMAGENGIEFLATIREKSPDLPFILYTGKGSEEVASEAISAGVTDYLPKKSDGSRHELLADRIGNAVERAEARCRALNQSRVNTLVRKINEALARATTRSEIDERICEIISDEEPYRFAWIGEHDPRSQTVTPRTTVGIDEKYLSSIEITTDEDSTSQGPTGRAVRTRELEVMQNIPDDPQYEPWREQALERGYRSSAAVPLVYEDTLYGVLNVYAGHTHAFSEHEQQLLSNLAETIAHAHHRVHLQRQYTEQYRLLFEEAPVMIVFTREVEGEPVIEDCNRAFAERLGYTPETLRDTRLAECYTDSSAADLLGEDGYQRALNGEFVRSQRMLKTRDGEEILTILSASPRQNRNGDVVGTHALYLDISDERQIQELQRYEQIIEASGDPVYTIDDDGRFTYVNDRFTEMAGYDSSELLGEHVSILMSEGDIAVAESLISSLLKGTDDRATFEMDLVASDGTHITCENHISLLMEDDWLQGTVGVIRDITSRKEREQVLTRQNDRLDAFTSVVSHDLRNPLNVAEGRLELASEECDSVHLEHVKRAHRRMNTLIEDLLTLAREGKDVTDRDAIDLEGLIEECWAHVETNETSLAVGVDRPIRADESRLKQVFENLIRNAVEHGGDDVTVTVGELDGGFYVEDDGPGIPEKDRGDVFDAGYSTSRDGTGFGLSIVKEIVEAHDWHVRLTEGADGGARFEITGIEYAE